MVFTATIFVVFWAIAFISWRATGAIFFLLNFGYIGTALGVGTMVYAILPKEKKSAGRKITQLLAGSYMLGFLGLLLSENMQLEGFFFFLFSGFFAGAVIHYAVAKIFGPLLFNRSWCGWSCWTAMILDLLPFPRSAGWIPGRLRLMRHLHFALSLGLVLALWFGFGYRLRGKSASLLWLIYGNAVYFGAALALAFVSRDNRAFCKYLCPVSVLLKSASRFSLMRIAGDRRKCTGCGECDGNCPMSIRVSEYVKQGKRILSTECILCQTCVSSCYSGALAVSFDLDLGGEELLYEAKPGKSSYPDRSISPLRLPE